MGLDTWICLLPMLPIHLCWVTHAPAPTETP